MDIRKALGLKKDEYHHKINAEMSEWDAQIERDRAERKRVAAQQEIDDDDEDYREYRARRQDADRKLSDLRNASEDKWEDMKTGVEKSWADVKNAFNKIGNRIRH
jgi:hypothetical protein